MLKENNSGSPLRSDTGLKIWSPHCWILNFIGSGFPYYNPMSPFFWIVLYIMCHCVLGVYNLHFNLTGAYS